MAWENIKWEVDAGVGVLTVDRPKALNALNRQTLTELEQVLSDLENQPQVKALILTGAGEKAFVAGADIAEMVTMPSEKGREFSEKGHRVMSLLGSVSVPTLAAVNGFSLGGGCELALACDLIYASEKAKFGLPELGLGVIPGFGGTQRLARLIGPARARELLFTGDMIDAQKAKEYGMVLEVVAPEKLMDHCKTVAAKIASKGPLAVAQAKRVMRLGADVSLSTANEIERQAFGVLFGTEDQKEAMKAFMEKRPTVFKGQ